MHPVPLNTKLLIKPNLFKPLPMKPTKYCSTWFYRVSHKHRSGGESTAPTTAEGACRDGGEQLVTSGENSLYQLISTYRHLKQPCRLLCPYPLPLLKRRRKHSVKLKHENVLLGCALKGKLYCVDCSRTKTQCACPCMPLTRVFQIVLRLGGRGGVGWGVDLIHMVLGIWGEILTI